MYGFPGGWRQTMETWRVNRGMLEVLVCESLLGIGPLPAWSSASSKLHNASWRPKDVEPKLSSLAVPWPSCRDVTTMLLVLLVIIGLETIDLALLGSLRGDKETKLEAFSPTG